MTSILRQRMLDAMVLSGKAARTQEAYIGAVFGLARHYHRSPDALSADDVQHYLLYLLRERHLSRSSVNQYGCAFRFLYGRVLGLDGQTFQIPLAPAPQRLPEILSRWEIAALLEHAPHTKARTLLCCAYALGLRVSELRAMPTAPSIARARSAGTTWLAMARASPNAAASTPCATIPSPGICRADASASRCRGQLAKFARHSFITSHASWRDWR